MRLDSWPGLQLPLFYDNVGPSTGEFMTEQNRNYIKKEVGKLLSDIWRIKGLSEQEFGSQHPITKKLDRMHADAQALLQEKY
jgi:hypothetical protein